MKIFHKNSEIMLKSLLKFKNLPRLHDNISEYRTFLELSKINANKAALFPKKKEILSDYPPILDTSEEGQKKHTRLLWYESLKSLPTVEEKLHDLAVLQKLKLKTYTLKSVPPTYSCANFNNYITRTHNIDGLPKILTDMSLDLELNDIREYLCELILNHYFNIWEENKSKNLKDYVTETNAGCGLANSLIRHCLKKLAVRNDYVLNATIQQKPRIFSFWWHGGYGTEKDELEERNLCFQFEDHAELAIRVKDPILPVVDMHDSLCSTAEVIDYNYHPDVFHIPHETASKVASVPAFWPGDPHEFPFLLVHSSSKFQTLTSKLQLFDEDKVITGAAVLSSFAWCNAIATYQGFNPFNDITYPIVTQTIVTNGQDWNFFVYQLNTVAFHEDVDKKDRRNLCWSSGRLRLFDTIENGQVKGINDEVFRVLLQLLHNAPQLREGVIMKPYVGADRRELDEILHMRYLLRKMYTRVPNVMAHREEVPTWVEIYKNHPDAPPTPLIRLA